jgi:hypothetical protein
VNSKTLKIVDILVGVCRNNLFMSLKILNIYANILFLYFLEKTGYIRRCGVFSGQLWCMGVQHFIEKSDHLDILRCSFVGQDMLDFQPFDVKIMV